MTRYLVVPQWQGSPSSRAMQLVDGALAIAGDLPRAATEILDVPVEAGESLGTGIRRLSSLQRIRTDTSAALAAHDEPSLTIGGDCGIALPAVERSLARRASVALVWFDAHPDFNSPSESSSGAFSGMVLRAIAGEGEPGLSLPRGQMPAERIILVGARSFDDAEQTALDEYGVRVIPPHELDPDALLDAVRATGAEAVHIHVDVDVLDPAELTGNAHPAPFGLALAELTSAIARIRSGVDLAGASLTGYSPASPEAATDDLGTLLRIIGALK